MMLRRMSRQRRTDRTGQDWTIGLCGCGVVESAPAHDCTVYAEAIDAKAADLAVSVPPTRDSPVWHFSC